MPHSSMLCNYKKLENEMAHCDRKIEWWFFQGYYDVPVSGIRYFMISIFRNKIESKSSKSCQGFSCIISVLNPITKKHETLSRIDSSYIELFKEFNEETWKAHLDGITVDAFSREIKEYGPFLPVQLEKTNPEFTAYPLLISWNAISLSQLEDSFILSFTEPESLRKCEFKLTPKHTRIFLAEKDSPRVNAMAYAIYPRLSMSGTCDNQKITGEAWMDHQWGDFGGWFMSHPKNGKLMGWDWFGINLENDIDLIVMIHRNMESKISEGQFALIRTKGEEAILCENFEINPIRIWKSPKTRINYPVSWEIKIPDFNIKLNFEPLADNQEISIFGFIRAIWEGAGTVNGTYNGEEIRGRARLELYGYGFIFDFKKHMDVLVKGVERSIENFFPKYFTNTDIIKFTGSPLWKHEPKAYNELLSKPVWDIMGRSSKYWRPLFGILLLEALGVGYEPYESLISCVSEMTHVGALIIDDIEDTSEIRRGDECIHLRYGTDVAINAGNTLYFIPYLLLDNHESLSDIQRMKLYRTLIRQSTKCHFGQTLDIYWSKNINEENLDIWLNDSIDEKILQMYAYKTASSSEGLAEIACITASSNDEILKTCTSFGSVFGVAFQIVDDIHNFSGSLKWKKTCGEDLQCGKLTYVIVKAIKMLSQNDSIRLKKILCSIELRNSEAGLNEGISLIRKSKALEECRKEAIKMFEEEWKKFSKLIPPSEPKATLRAHCTELLKLTYDT